MCQKCKLTSFQSLLYDRLFLLLLLFPTYKKQLLQHHLFKQIDIIDQAGLPFKYLGSCFVTVDLSDANQKVKSTVTRKAY